MSFKNFRNFIQVQIKKGENIQLHKSSGEDEMNYWNGLPEFSTESSVIVEKGSNSLEIKDVEIKTDKSQFAYFLDGIEKQKVVCSYNFIPIIYGYVAAAILKRENKKLYSTSLESSKDAFYLPLKENGDEPERYFEKQNFDFKYQNSGKFDKFKKKYPEFPLEFEQAAHSDIQESRRKIEQNLTEMWLNEGFNDGWLYIDGRLEPLSQKLKENSKAVGVIKSHKTYYFPPEEQFKIYSMKKGQRTCVFQPQRNNKPENVYSWYLKIHENNKGDINTGIIRIETSATPEILNMVDEISSWILLETNPIAFPASRWDKMIYPIKYCEDYLKSKAPSKSVLSSLTI